MSFAFTISDSSSDEITSALSDGRITLCKAIYYKSAYKLVAIRTTDVKQMASNET